MSLQSQIESKASLTSWIPQVPRGILQRKCASGNSTAISSDCDACQKKRMQRSAINSTKADEVPSTVHEVLRSPGQPLDADTRSFMEPRFGHSFSRFSVYPTSPQSYPENLVIGSAQDHYEREADANASRVAATTPVPAGGRADFGSVRVHTDSHAAESARAVGARAYTLGDHIVFGAGRYAPQTSEGRTLLAHELTHVQQQTAGGPDVLRRQPKGGEKADEPAAKFVDCDKDRLPVVQDAIKKAEALASRAVQAFEREYPLSYESAAMKAHFGSLGSDQKATIIERYKHVLSKSGSKTYACAKDNMKVKEGDEVVDLCGQARCPGHYIILFPNFGKETCPAGPVMLHEAVHNAGACDDIDRGRSYPPSSSENNAYSYEYFALDVTAGYKTPELGKRKPTVPRVP